MLLQIILFVGIYGTLVFVMGQSIPWAIFLYAACSAAALLTVQTVVLRSPSSYVVDSDPSSFFPTVSNPDE